MSASDRSPSADDDYDVFISYSHAADGKLAPAVQAALRRFGKPWYERSHVRIFRDQTGLGLTPDLWGDIQRRLERSRCFLLLAGPEAARSEWVEKEIRFWLEHRAGHPLLVALTGGKLDWDGRANDFDWTYTDALPPSLQKVFPHEPLWADLTWARSDADLSLRKPQFFAEIAKIVAGMRGLPLDRVFDEAAVQQRKATRLFRGAMAALVVATIVALGAAFVGLRQWRTVEALNQVESERASKQKAAEEERRSQEALAEQQREASSVSVRWAAKAASVLPRDRELSTLLALEAVNQAPTIESERALRKALLEPVRPVVMRGHSGPVQAEFCAGGSRVLTTGEDKTIRVWDTNTGKSVRSFPITVERGDYAMSAVSADGSRVLAIAGPETYAVGFWKSTTPLKIFDTESGTRVTAISDEFAARADLSPDGTKVVTAGFDTSAKIWDAVSGKLLFELSGHEQRVTSAKFSSDGSRAVTCGYDGTVRVWDTNTGASLAVLRDPEELVCSDVRFSPDGERILTLGGTDAEKHDVLQIWDWAHAPGAAIAKLEGHEGAINALAFSPDGKHVVSGGTRDHTVRIWDAASGKCIHLLTGFDDFVNGVAVSPDEKWVVAASGDGMARIWDAATGEELLSFERAEYPLTCAAFSPDGRHFVTATTHGEVLIYSLPILGSVDDLKALAAKRSTRALTADERQTYLNELSPGS